MPICPTCNDTGRVRVPTNDDDGEICDNCHWFPTVHLYHPIGCSGHILKVEKDYAGRCCSWKERTELCIQCFDYDGAPKTLEVAELRIKNLERRIVEQRDQLKFANENNRKRNLELDALHYVWCDGGCSGGAHRWQDRPPTQEIVKLAVRNTNRLVTYFVNMENRKVHNVERLNPVDNVKNYAEQLQERIQILQDALKKEEEKK